MTSQRHFQNAKAQANVKGLESLLGEEPYSATETLLYLRIAAARDAEISARQEALGLPFQKYRA